MILSKELNGLQIFVLGLGRTGLSILDYLKHSGANVACWDDNERARVYAQSLGYTLEDLHKKSNWKNTDRLIISPGIAFLYPEPHKVVKNARESNVNIDNDIGLFFSSLHKIEWDRFQKQPKVIAITGSNGKSTTSFLIHHILQKIGIPSEIGGNFGKPVLSLKPFTDGEIKIIELSSYQIEAAKCLQPDISVFLNFSPDHLERHGGIGGYFHAKQRLFLTGNADKNIVGLDEKEGKFLFHCLDADRLGCDLNIPFSSENDLSHYKSSVFIKKGFLIERKGEKQVASIDLRPELDWLKTFNIQNICAAYAVCRSMNISPKIFSENLKTFKGLPHRNQLVVVRDGIKFINDSKATNAKSAVNSVNQHSNVHLILGGVAKRGGIEELLGSMKNVKRVYLIGEAAELFSKQLGSAINFEISKTLDFAVKSASQNAVSGDSILLAPACASFDQFKDFEDRGNTFIKLVNELKN